MPLTQKISKDELIEKVEQFAVLKTSFEDMKEKADILERDILSALKNNKSYENKSFIVENMGKDKKFIVAARLSYFGGYYLLVSEVVE